MPTVCRAVFLVLFLLVGRADLIAQVQKAKPAYRQRISSRFSAPSAAASGLQSASASQRQVAPTTVSIMHRETYLDGQRPYQRPRTRFTFSFHLLPTLSWNTVRGGGTYAHLESTAPSLQYSVGPSLDIQPGDKPYALSTGLWYTAMRAGFIRPASEGGGVSAFRLKYVQLPVTFKWLNDNLIRTGRVYVQGGLVVGLNVSEQAIDPATNLLYQRSGGRPQFGGGDLGLLLAAGFVRQVSASNAVIISLQYQRGLINTSRIPDLTSRNNLLALGAGLRF